MKVTEDQLQEAGLDGAAAAEKAALFRRAAEALAGCVGGDDGAEALFVPGRIEVVGKHVDYAAGRSLTCAVNRGFCFVSRPRDDDVVRMVRADGGGEATFRLAADVPGKDGDWSNYPITVARRIARNFPNARRGADIAFSSDLPPASGLSSSSALVVATFLVLARANYLEDDPLYRAELARPEDLAGYLGAVENGLNYGNLPGSHGVGTFGGSEDHTAILCGRPGTLSQFAYCPTRLERRVAMPTGYTFVIAFCGTHAEKAAGARAQYNLASSLSSDALAVWRRETGRDDAYLARAVQASPGAVEEIRAVLRRAASPQVCRRFEHFYLENEQIVPQASVALAGGDVEAFGRVVDRSQQLGAELLGNQIPQTIHLADAARNHGAAAASAFGAGFGGSVWMLVAESEADAFITACAADYARAFPDDARSAVWFTTQAAPPAFWL